MLPGGIITFFVLLDIVVGLGGHYDMIVSALATAVGLRALYKRRIPKERTGFL